MDFQEFPNMRKETPILPINYLVIVDKPKPIFQK